MKKDEDINRAIAFVRNHRRVNIQAVQRRLRVPYEKAEALVGIMVTRGVLKPSSTEEGRFDVVRLHGEYHVSPENLQFMKATPAAFMGSLGDLPLSREKAIPFIEYVGNLHDETFRKTVPINFVGSIGAYNEAFRAAVDLYSRRFDHEMLHDKNERRLFDGFSFQPEESRDDGTRNIYEGLNCRILFSGVDNEYVEIFSTREVFGEFCEVNFSTDFPFMTVADFVSAAHRFEIDLQWSPYAISVLSQETHDGRV